MTQFLQTLCRTCQSCENLITLHPDPEQCEKCAVEERKEAFREQQDEIERKVKVSIKKSMRYDTESDSSNSDKPLKYTIKKVKNEYCFENDNDLMTIGVSDIESIGEQEENVSSTTAAAITTNTTTTAGSAHTATGSSTPSSDTSKLPTGPPQEWSVEGVIKFIADTDPALAIHAELFRKHVGLLLDQLPIE